MKSGDLRGQVGVELALMLLLQTTCQRRPETVPGQCIQFLEGKGTSIEAVRLCIPARHREPPVETRKKKISYFARALVPDVILKPGLLCGVRRGVTVVTTTVHDMAQRGIQHEVERQLVASTDERPHDGPVELSSTGINPGDLLVCSLTGDLGEFDTPGAVRRAAHLGPELSCITELLTLFETPGSSLDVTRQGMKT